MTQPQPVEVRLYVASGPNSLAGITNLKTAISEHSALVVLLEVVDVIRDPERGLRDGVLVAPRLVKITPPPERRILGTLVNRRVLLAALGLPTGDDA